MSRIPANKAAALSHPNRGALTAEIERVLALLSEVEACYKSDRECLKDWSGLEAIKVRLAEHLDAHHAQERELLVQRLVQLQQQITTALLIQRLGSMWH